MEMRLDGDAACLPSGSDVMMWLNSTSENNSGKPPVETSSFRLWLASLVLGTSLLLPAQALAASMPHFGTSPLIDDTRPVVATTSASKSASPGTVYRQILTQSFGDQAKEARGPKLFLSWK